MFLQTPVDSREDAGNIIIQNKCLVSTNIKIRLSAEKECIKMGYSWLDKVFKKGIQNKT
jgi:hypothetical protein